MFIDEYTYFGNIGFDCSRLYPQDKNIYCEDTNYRGEKLLHRFVEGNHAVISIY